MDNYADLLGEDLSALDTEQIEEYYEELQDAQEELETAQAEFDEQLYRSSSNEKLALSIEAYKEAIESGDKEAIEKARKNYEAAQAAYNEEFGSEQMENPIQDDTKSHKEEPEKSDGKSSSGKYMGSSFGISTNNGYGQIISKK